MKVGLTYDLRDEYLAEGYGDEETAEFDRPETIEAIDAALRRFGFETDRIGHAKDLVKRLARGDRWDWVFNIAEGMYGIGREALVPALLEAYQIPCTFSDSMVLALTLHKGMTKHVIKHLGIPTPDFAIIEIEHDLANVNLAFPLFAKPVAEGTGKGITAASKLANRDELQVVCRRLLAEYRQPVLVERFLPGREYTVGLFGTGREARAFGAMEVVLNAEAENDVYSYHNKEHYEGLVEYRLVEGEAGEKAKAVALAAWRGLGCRDAGRIDVREDEHGVPNFIEVNPLAGIRPIHSDLCIICNLLGISYNQMIETIVRSALRRFDLPFPSAVA
ncbi:D-alanine--D-alanine ligase [Candidatus Moduliflexus flocculans]|uniref:D-alanine--D-alanine ligase n=1 Tax=Candidatus Moduliflexus flocculans TaxID=1499966 RepID=A0A081BP56_9BACT|nr:D-alanine--D-alanine ligase [Candidatus Moduliflexus flocculans]